MAADNAGDGVINVVATTNVYGDVAQRVGGAAVEVTSLIERADQDPHEFEASGRDQLALSRADIVIVNGGGYDDFASTMLAASGNSSAQVVDAVTISGFDATADGFNEHVFYDYPTMAGVADELATALHRLDPAHADTFDANARAFASDLSALEQREAALAGLTSGAGVIITEPVPLYVLLAGGFDNLTPAKFSAAIEDDTDVPATLLQSVLNLISGGSVAVVVYNSQTGGPQTDAIIEVATDALVPLIGIGETLPEGTNYIDWQSGLLDDLTDAVS
ncbi:zinc ABC transporter substrate-binding protein [soil metagenome]